MLMISEFSTGYASLFQIFIKSPFLSVKTLQDPILSDFKKRKLILILIVSYMYVLCMYYMYSYMYLAFY